MPGTLREGGQTGKRDKLKRFGQRKRERERHRQADKLAERKKTDRERHERALQH